MQSLKLCTNGPALLRRSISGAVMRPVQVSLFPDCGFATCVCRSASPLLVSRHAISRCPCFYSPAVMRDSWKNSLPALLECVAGNLPLSSTLSPVLPEGFAFCCPYAGKILKFGCRSGLLRPLPDTHAELLRRARPAHCEVHPGTLLGGAPSSFPTCVCGIQAFGPCILRRHTVLLRRVFRPLRLGGDNPTLPGFRKHGLGPAATFQN